MFGVEMIFLLPTLSFLRTNSPSPLPAWRSGFPVPSWAVRFIFVVYPVLVFFFLMNLKLNFSQFSTILNPVPCCQQHFLSLIFSTMQTTKLLVSMAISSALGANLQGTTRSLTAAESGVADIVFPNAVTPVCAENQRDHADGGCPRHKKNGGCSVANRQYLAWWARCPESCGVCIPAAAFKTIKTLNCFQSSFCYHMDKEYNTGMPNAISGDGGFPDVKAECLASDPNGWNQALVASIYLKMGSDCHIPPVCRWGGACL